MDSKLVYETLPGKEVVYVLLIPFVLGRLPVVPGWSLEIQGPSRSDIAVAVATAPIDTTTTSLALIQAEGLVISA